jgi:hypothetical protein
METEKERLVAYVLEHGDNIEFTRHFWNGCEPLEADVIQYHKFTQALQMTHSGEDPDSISLDLETSVTTARNWRALSKMPKLSHFLKAFLNLGAPTNGRVWLTLEQSHGYAVPVGQFIQVPTTIQTWEDVDLVLSQIKPMRDETTKFTKPHLFGFLLGIIIGDAHKPKQGTGTDISIWY